MKLGKKIMVLGLMTLIIIATIMPVISAKKIVPVKDQELKELKAKPLELDKLYVKVPEIVEEGTRFAVHITKGDFSDSTSMKADNGVERALVRVMHDGKTILWGFSKGGVVKFTAPMLPAGSRDWECMVIASAKGCFPVSAPLTIRDTKQLFTELTASIL